MALTNLETWISDRIEWLTPRHAASLRRAVNTDIKKARPTVRAKRPIQQLKPKMLSEAAFLHEWIKLGYSLKNALVVYNLFTQHRR